MSKLVAALILATFIGIPPAFDAISGSLDSAVNSLLAASGAPSVDATKVVPIVNASGVYAGAAQITGKSADLRAVKAVVEIKTQSGAASITTLIPVTKVSGGLPLHRKYGVGVDAVINTQF